MAIFKQGEFIHVPRAYNEPQERMCDLVRALRMQEILRAWDADNKANAIKTRGNKPEQPLSKPEVLGNKPNKADVTYTKK